VINLTESARRQAKKAAGICVPAAAMHFQHRRASARGFDIRAQRATGTGIEAFAATGCGGIGNTTTRVPTCTRL
jgi:hypothetical protein